VRRRRAPRRDDPARLSRHDGRGLEQVVYRVSGVDGSGEGDCTAPLVVRPGGAPFLLGAEPAAVRVVRVIYSQAMDESATRLENYRSTRAGASRWR